MYKRQLLGAVSSAALAYNCEKSTSKNRSSAKSEQEAQIIAVSYTHLDVYKRQCLNLQKIK